MSNFLHKCNGECKIYILLLIGILGLLLYQCYNKSCMKEGWFEGQSLSAIQIELIIQAASEGITPSPSQLAALSPEELVSVQNELNKFHKKV